LELLKWIERRARRKSKENHPVSKEVVLTKCIHPPTQGPEFVDQQAKKL
jgi:hypothetical protein